MSQYIKEKDGTWTKVGGIEKSFEEYSTDETVIGRWIDGKPIYRKVIQANTPSSSAWIDTATVSSDIATCIKILGVFVTDGQKVPFPYGEERYQVNCTITAEGKLRVYVQHSVYYNKPFVVTVEYTKTTD